MDNDQSRTLSLRGFKRRADRCPDLRLDQSWNILHDAVVKIRQKKRADISCEELYRLVQDLCNRNMGTTVFEHLQALILSFAKEEYNLLTENTKNIPSCMFLQELDRVWNSYCEEMLMIRSIFLYMDRTYRDDPTSIMSISIWDYSLKAFRIGVIENPQLKQYMVKSLLSIIEEERAGDKIDRYLMKSLLRMLINLQIYDTVFEPEFLRTTQTQYENEARIKLQEMDISDYLRHVTKRIAEEEDRIDVYLDMSTTKKLINVVDTCFLTNCIDGIISKSTEQLFSERKLKDLTLLYNLLSRIRGGLKSLKDAFTTYVKKVGRSLIADISREKTLVQDLMDFKSGLDTIISNCFRKNEKFIQASKDAFDYFINTRPNKPAELIAKFMDSKLKTGNKECSDDELDGVMDRAIVLFRFVQGKDVFEAFYKKDLAKRLLLGRSASVDAEKAMLSKLKNECGAAFTQKLEGMFKDMEVSKDICAAFKQFLDSTPHINEDSPRPEVNVNILTMGNWPSYPTVEVNVPKQLSHYLELCTTFYSSKYTGRKLSWQHTLTSAILKAQFRPKVSKELDVSLFQTTVLLMFNTKLKFSYEEISAETKIEVTELKRVLQSLACGKVRVLHKIPKGKDVNDGDEFVLNEQINVHLHRIRISQIQMRETEEEHKQTEEQIFQDRQYQIDAAVVRIMKMRKNLAHNHLLTELFSQLRFPAKPIDLKKRIESLIERDYISRDKDDAQLYHYVA